MDHTNDNTVQEELDDLILEEVSTAQPQTSETPPIQEDTCNEEVSAETKEVAKDLSDVLCEEPVQPVEEKQAIQESPYQEKKQKSFEELLNDSYIDMDKEFQKYLKNFNDDSSKSEDLKLKLKENFFVVIMFMLAAIIYLPYHVLFMFRDKVTDVAVITVCISSLAETISAIIVLPKIIAKYLFNKDEEKNKIRIIRGMQKYNKNKRNKPSEDKTKNNIRN